MKSNYRPDIDGLRAIAVLSVIIFHISEIYLPGGFLGVDIFFIISGYLITNIVHTEINQNNFSFSRFYQRRMKRILPAFFFMVILTLLIGYIVLLPYEYFKLGISAASTLLFISNMQFSFRIGDYFANESGEWPLLHTWSLAVEEQYYFILPLLLIFCLKRFNTKTIMLLSILSLFSFTLASYWAGTAGFEKFSYYSLPTRMGELLIGSILAVYMYKNPSKKITKNSITIIAIFIIISSLYLVNSNMLFPGFVALPIGLATALLIVSEGTYLNKVLSNKLLVSIGLISYSLYLVHWPILAFLRYIFNIESDTLPINIQYIALLLIIIFACISYFLIEKPCRKIDISFKKTLLFFLIIPSFLIGSGATFIILDNGLPDRLSSENFDSKKGFSHLNKDKCPLLINLGCQGGANNSDKNVILFGNSHAEHYFTFIDKVSFDSGYSLKLIASGGCDLLSSSLKCNKIKDYFFANYTDADSIIVAYQWNSLIEDQNSMNALKEFIIKLRDTGKIITLLAQPPLWNVELNKITNCRRLKLTCDVKIKALSNYPYYNQAIEDFANKLNVGYFDPFKFIDNKFVLNSAEGHPYYFDNNHLSVYGNEMLYKVYQSKASKSFFL